MFGFIYDSNKKLERAVENEEEYRRMLEQNTWIIHGENIGKSPDKLPENIQKSSYNFPEKSQNISGNNTGKILEKSENNTQKVTEKVLEKPEKMLVNKPEKSDNYDVNTLEYCCKILEHLVVVDGASIKLVDNGLVLKSNPGYPAFRLKYCPNCGVPIEHDEIDKEDIDVQKPKEIQRDKPK